MSSGVDELDAVMESLAVADYAAQVEFEGLVGNEEFEDQTGARCEFAGQEQEHAAAADVAGFATIIRAVSACEYGDVDGNGRGVAFPSARVWVGTGSGCGVLFVGRHRPLQFLAGLALRTIGRR